MGFVVEFLKSLPAIIAFIAQVRSLIDDAYHWSERREALKGLSNAVKKYNETGDVGELERFTNELRNKSQGSN